MGLKKKIEFGHKLEELVSQPKILQVDNDAVIHNGHAEIHCLLYLSRIQHLEISKVFLLCYGTLRRSETDTCGVR